MNNDESRNKLREEKKDDGKDDDDGDAEYMQKEVAEEEEEEDEGGGNNINQSLGLKRVENGKRRRTGLLGVTPQPEPNIIHSVSPQSPILSFPFLVFLPTYPPTYLPFPI